MRWSGQVILSSLTPHIHGLKMHYVFANRIRRWFIPGNQTDLGPVRAAHRQQGAVHRRATYRRAAQARPVGPVGRGRARRWCWLAAPWGAARDRVLVGATSAAPRGLWAPWPRPDARVRSWSG